MHPCSIKFREPISVVAGSMVVLLGDQRLVLLVLGDAVECGDDLDGCVDFRGDAVDDDGVGHRSPHGRDCPQPLAVPELSASPFPCYLC